MIANDISEFRAWLEATMKPGDRRTWKSIEDLAVEAYRNKYDPGRPSRADITSWLESISTNSADAEFYKYNEFGKDGGVTTYIIRHGAGHDSVHICKPDDGSDSVPESLPVAGDDDDDDRDDCDCDCCADPPDPSVDGPASPIALPAILYEVRVDVDEYYQTLAYMPSEQAAREYARKWIAAYIAHAQYVETRNTEDLNDADNAEYNRLRDAIAGLTTWEVWDRIGDDGTGLAASSLEIYKIRQDADVCMEANHVASIDVADPEGARPKN